jgi:hypothetical protein
MPKTFGVVPVMVGSNACHLEGMTPKQLVALKEEVCTSLLNLCVDFCCSSPTDMKYTQLLSVGQ